MLIDQALQTMNNMIRALGALAPKIAIAIVVFMIFWFVSRFARAMVVRFWDRAIQRQNVGTVLGRITQVAIITFGFFVSCTIVFPSVRASTLVNLFGISGVAIGFAFKEILQNFLAGLIILINQPFKVGDRIKVQDFEGVIEDIQARATVIRATDRKIIVPNATLFTNSVSILRADRSETSPQAT